MNSNAFIKRLTHVEIDGFVERIPSFTTGKAGIFLTLVGITFNLFNMYTDIALGITYLYNEDVWWGGLTLGFVLLSSIMISLFTFSLHKRSNGMFLTKLKVSKPLIYTLCLFLHGHFARCLMWLKLLYEEIPLIGVKAALWIFRDITSYAEVFIESIPQLCLQCYVITIDQGDATDLQKASVIASWLSASWGLLSQFDGFYWKLIAFELNLFWFAARALAVALLASVHKVVAPMMFIVHFLLMLPLWFWQNSYKPFRKKRDVSRSQIVITDIFYSTIYATCNTATPITCNYPLCLAFVLALENITCYVLADHLGEFKRSKSHFKRYGYKNDTYKCHPDESVCRGKLEHWRWSGEVIEIGHIITIIALLQVVLISLMKYKKVIREDAMVSQLGSYSFRKSQSRQASEAGLENTIYSSNNDIPNRQFNHKISVAEAGNGENSRKNTDEVRNGLDINIEKRQSITIVENTSTTIDVDAKWNDVESGNDDNTVRSDK